MTTNNRDRAQLEATEVVGDPSMLKALAQMEMPFGRYKGCLLIDLPEPYVVWFHQQGMPSGRLGQLLGLLYEIKVNGLESLVRQIGTTDAEQLPPRSRRATKRTS